MRRIALRICLLALLCLAMTAPASPSRTAAAAATKPNVILILIDDARLDDLSTMPVVTSRIGNRGVTFTRAYAPFSLCCPARATLLTGQYAHNHHVLGNSGPLGGFFKFKDAETIATWLDADYVTSWMGKYLNMYGGFGSREYVPPGWDDWRGALGGSFDDYRGTRFNMNGRITDYYSEYQTDLLSDFSTDFIKEHSAGEQPFFLTLSYFAPHTGRPEEPDDPTVVYNTSRFQTPNVADRHRDAFANLEIDDRPEFDEADVSDKPEYIRRVPTMADWQLAAMREVNQQRRESLLAVEDGVRRIIRTLRRTGALDNTYILFTSDNGMMMGDHRIRVRKSYPYEGSAHVPLLVRGPGLPAGTVVDDVVGQQDVAPTILDMAGLRGAQGTFPIDGRNLLRLVSRPGAFGGRPIVLEKGPASASSDVYQYEGVVKSRWKYVEYSTGEKELYDMRNDPHELENRADDPAYAAPQRRMADYLARYRRCAGASCH